MIKDVVPLLKECEETLKELKEMNNMQIACYVQGFINSINKLPVVEERPCGEWISSDAKRDKCSVCDFKIGKYVGVFYRFCPNCGADMRDKKDDLAEIIEAAKNMKEW